LAIKAQFALDWHGHHGLPHWTRARAIGLQLAKSNGANPHVVELFAFFHDSRRISDHQDFGHGARGFDLAKSFQGRYFEATASEMALLEEACVLHSDAKTQSSTTVMTCWDADRLDLMRVGLVPLPQYLCTPEAKDGDTIDLACRRAQAWAVRHSPTARERSAN
jgi:uncharacterized protein